MKLSIDPAELRPLIQTVVDETLERFPAERIGYTEAEAAELLGVARHVLRDARLRGEVQHGKIGAKIVYSRRQLHAFIEGRGDSQ